MSARGDNAKELFLKGNNCAQAVLMSFADKIDMPEEQLKNISAGFGGGIGRLREVCGTFSGLVMALGLISGDKVDKAALYAQIQRLSEKFKQDNGSIICRDLLGMRKNEKSAPTPSERTENYYKSRPCADLVKYAAELLEQEL